MLSEIILADEEASKHIKKLCLDSYNEKAYEIKERLLKIEQKAERKLCYFAALFVNSVLNSNTCSDCIKVLSIQKCVWKYALTRLWNAGISIPDDYSYCFEILTQAIALLDGSKDQRGVLDELLARFATD